jgi:hypothetical protein
VYLGASMRMSVIKSVPNKNLETPTGTGPTMTVSRTWSCASLSAEPT